MRDTFFICRRPTRAAFLIASLLGLGVAGASIAQATPVTVEFRSIDGSGNNLTAASMGAAGTMLRRTTAVGYMDSMSEMAGADRPSARAVSNMVCAEPAPRLSAKRASAFVWQWGQFLDHDIDLTQSMQPAEVANIAVPMGDPWFDPMRTGTAVIPFTRSAYNPATGNSASNPRQQMNSISAWIDASNVYGSDAVRAAALRRNNGSGKLRTSKGRLLPRNTNGLPNAGGIDRNLFLAGDIRANEQAGLTVMHTLFVREHNRWCRRIKRRSPQLSGQTVYQRARRMVGAELQAITYREFLPMLLGAGAIGPYRGYDPTVDASIHNVFSTASYRYGHSQLNATLLRLKADGSAIADGHLPLDQAFFAPDRIRDEGGITPFLRGLGAQRALAVDIYVTDSVRNFLFGPPGAGGFDLAALNIQRGRDHGLASYNAVRAAYGLAQRTSFDQVSSKAAVRARLAEAYSSVDQIDAWIGGLAEDRKRGALVGELTGVVLAEQFTALRDGDRFWYERELSPEKIAQIHRLTLSRIIAKNTGARRSILGRNAFRVKR